MQVDKTPAWRSPQFTPRRLLWKRLKARIREILLPYPALQMSLVRAWRSMRFNMLRIKWKLEARIGGLLHTHARDIDVDRIYWVSPARIVFSALREFSINGCKGRILGGDWDRLEKRFDSLDLYVAMQQVCVEGKAWTDTVFYHRLLDQLQQAHPVYTLPFKDEAGLRAACASMEALYHSIKDNGYKTQRELLLAGQIQDPLQAEEEVAVCIGRYGDLLFSDGAHRLVIAKLLDLPSIPVKIAVRHKEWMRFRQELALYAKDDPDDNRGVLYQPVTHPDLVDLVASHPCEDRFELIRDNMSTRHGRLLDIGANLGYFCQRFEEEGLECWAVELNTNAAYFMERLARAENRKFKILAQSVFLIPELRTTHFDVVLALNIFHHFIKTPEYHEKLIDLLEHLQMGEMFFEPQVPEEEQMDGAYRNYSAAEFVQFIQNHSALKKVDQLGTMHNGRPLYRLYQ